MLKKFIQKFCIFTTITLCVISCRFDKLNWELDILAPIATTSLSFQNFLSDSLFTVDPNEQLRLNFETNLFEIPIDSLLNIPDTTLFYEVISPLTININPGVPLDSYNNEVLFNIPIIRLTEAIAEEGKFKVQIKNFTNRKIDVTFTIPRATKGGVSISFEDVIQTGSAANPFVYTREFDLSGYWLNLRGDNNNLFNRLRIIIFTKLDATGEVLPVTQGQKLLELSNSFIGLKPYYAKGDFGTQKINLNTDTLRLNFMKKFKQGSLDLEKAEFKLMVENGIGSDIQARFFSIKGVNTATENQVELLNGGLNPVLNVTRATNNLWNTPEFFPTQKEYVVNEQNTNLLPFISNLPDLVKVNADFTVNPITNISGGNDFIFSKSKAFIKLGVNVPLNISINNLLFVDTVAYNIYNENQNNPIESADLRILVKNGFPYNFDLRLYIMDDFGIVDSLVTQSQIVAAPVNSSLRVVEKVESELRIRANASQAEKFFRGNRFLIKVKANSLNSPQILPVFEEYKMDLKVIANFKYQLAN